MTYAKLHSKSLPLMNEKGLPPEEVLRLLDERLKEDFSYRSGRILGSMCTKPHRLAKQVYLKYIEKNLGDPNLFPGTAELEREVVQMIGELLSNPGAFGHIVSGGTEANILAMWAIRKLARKKEPEVIVPESAHFSFDKGAELLGIKLVKAKLNEHFEVDTNDVRKLISDNTIMIVGIAGTTALGVVDPIEELSQMALERGVHLHVDAAFGGFVLPFLKELGYSVREFDFKLPGVGSITVDPHKMGLVPIPAGCILFCDIETYRAICMEVPYLSGGKTTLATMLSTRPGASAIATWALLKHLGRGGYRKIVSECMSLTYRLADELREIKGIKLLVHPIMNIVGFTSDLVRVEELAIKLRKKGWTISLFPSHIRIVVMPHLKLKHIERFVRDVKETMKIMGNTLK